MHFTINRLSHSAVLVPCTVYNKGTETECSCSLLACSEWRNNQSSQWKEKRLTAIRIQEGANLWTLKLHRTLPQDISRQMWHLCISNISPLIAASLMFNKEGTACTSPPSQWCNQLLFPVIPYFHLVYIQNISKQAFCFSLRQQILLQLFFLSWCDKRAVTPATLVPLLYRADPFQFL